MARDRTVQRRRRFLQGSLALAGLGLAAAAGLSCILGVFDAGTLASRQKAAEEEEEDAA